MEDTCLKDKCFWWNLGDGPCPNYVEGWWAPTEGPPKLICDCAPKRILLLLQEVYNRVLGVQQSNEQQRNVTAQALGAILQLATQKKEALPFKRDEVIDVVAVEVQEDKDETDNKSE